MTSLPLPRTIAALFLAGTWTALSFGAVVTPAPAAAAPSAAPLSATLAEPSRDARVVAGSTLWLCQGTACVAREGGSRPGRLCRDLQRKVGTITAFTVDGKELDTEALTRCNA